VSYLLDANVIINWLKGRPGAASLIDGLARRQEVVAVNAVAIAEVYSGVAEGDVPRTQGVLEAFEYWTIDEATARLAGQYRYRYARLGTPLSVTDMLMAAHTITRGATLVTGNVRDFPMPELRLLRLP